MEQQILSVFRSASTLIGRFSQLLFVSRSDLILYLVWASSISSKNMSIIIRFLFSREWNGAWSSRFIHFSALLSFLLRIFSHFPWRLFSNTLVFSVKKFWCSRQVFHANNQSWHLARESSKVIDASSKSS